jgi:hypothetical protein
MKLYEVTVTFTYLALANDEQQAERFSREVFESETVDTDVQEIHHRDQIQDKEWMLPHTLVYHNKGWKVDITVDQALDMVSNTEQE